MDKACRSRLRLYGAAERIPACLFQKMCDYNPIILNSHRKIEKWSEQKLRQTRRRTQAGLTPGKDDNEVWHHFCRSRLKVSMGVQY